MEFRIVTDAEAARIRKEYLVKVALEAASAEERVWKRFAEMHEGYSITDADRGGFLSYQLNFPDQAKAEEFILLQAMTKAIDAYEGAKNETAT